MKKRTVAAMIFLIVVLIAAQIFAAEIKVDLSREQVAKPPVTFEPIVGTWIVAQDGKDKVVMVECLKHCVQPRIASLEWLSQGTALC